MGVRITPDYILWSDLILEHPVVALEAFLSINSGYWFPEIANSYVATDIYENDLGLSVKPLVQPLNKLLKQFRPDDFVMRPDDWAISPNRPFIYLLFGVGMMFWYIILAVLMNWVHRRFRFSLVFLPFICLWIGLLIAAPIFCLPRYAYSFFCLMPISLYFIFLRPSQET